MQSTQAELEARLQTLKALRSEASQNSQNAYKMGLGAEAKRLSNLRGEYNDQIEAIVLQLKELKTQNKKEGVIVLTEDMEAIITAEYQRIKSAKAIGDYRVLKSLHEEFLSKMKQNFSDSQKKWHLGQKPEARKHSEMGKAYRIMVHFANESMKEARKIGGDNIPAVGDYKDFINRLSQYNLDEMLADSDEYREVAGFFATEMKNSFEAAKDAWNKGDKAKAKECSDLGYENRQKMQNFNQNAMKAALIKNNAEKPMEVCDLHGLTVKEAELVLGERFSWCMDNRVPKLRVIVGKGLHSGPDGPKLRTLVENYAGAYAFDCEAEVGNDGCFVISGFDR